MKTKNKRRGNNEGSIYQRKDGLWVGCISKGFDKNGKRIRTSFYAKIRAEVAAKLITNLNYNLQNKRPIIISEDLQTLMTEWLLNHKRNFVSPRTFEKDISTAMLHIFPMIGQMKFSDITTITIQKFLNAKKAEGYALPTIKKIKFLLHQFFDYAETNEWIINNPVNKFRLQATEKKIVTQNEYKAIPIEARHKILEALDRSEILKPICMTMMFAGLRISEVLALKWNNIDFENEVLTVNFAITNWPTFDEEGKTIKRETVISNTKSSASMREVPLPSILINALEEWRKIRWIRERETGISFLKPTDLVFSNNKGKLRSYQGLRPMFKRLMKKHGLENYNLHFHTLRHTFSTMLFEAGENPKVVQMLLGHKDITTTLKIYNNIDRSYFKQAVAKLDGIIF